MAIKRKILVYGLSRVGLATIACLGKKSRLMAYDEDEERIKAFANGVFDTGEKELDKALTKYRAKISFSNNSEALKEANVFVLCLALKETNGEIDTSPLDKALDTIRASVSEGDVYILIRSMVPVGTAARYQSLLKKDGVAFHVIFYPAFNPSGFCYAEEKNPYRLVVGASKKDDFAFFRDLRKDAISLGAPVYEMTNSSAELALIASKAYLAGKQAFANSLANVASKTGANIKSVLEAMGADPRIGKACLNTGLDEGEAGSLDALAVLSSNNALMHACQEANENAYQSIWALIVKAIGSMEKKKVALFGVGGSEPGAYGDLARLGKDIVSAGADFYVYDPSRQALHAFKQSVPEAHAFVDASRVLEGADALIIASKGSVYARFEEETLIKLMKGRVIVDLSNQLPLKSLKHFKHVSFGRKTIAQDETK